MLFQDNVCVGIIVAMYHNRDGGAVVVIQGKKSLYLNQFEMNPGEGRWLGGCPTLIVCPD